MQIFKNRNPQTLYPRIGLGHCGATRAELAKGGAVAMKSCISSRHIHTCAGEAECGFYGLPHILCAPIPPYAVKVGVSASDAPGGADAQRFTETQGTTISGFLTGLRASNDD